MALLWIEGFEDYGTVTGTSVGAYIGRHYAGYNSSVSYYLTAGRTGGYGANSNDTSNGYLQTPNLTTANTLVVGCAIKPTTVTTSAYTFLKLYDGATLGVNFKWNGATGEIDAYRGTTLLGSTSGAGLLTGYWVYVEFKVKCDSSAGTVEVRVGGATKLSLSGINTKAGSDSYHNNVYLHALAYISVDDIYILDTTGSLNNDFLGNRKVVGLFPNGDSATVQWTPSSGSTHAPLVSETKDNDDADYVESAAAGQTDLYDYPDISNVSVVSGIQINTTCRETDATSFSLITPVKSGAATSEDTAQAIGSTTYVNRRRILETDPATGSAWSTDGLNAAQIGVKVG